MKLLVGLGNPGKDYADTKHNFGFWVIDRFAEKRSLKYKSGKGEYVYAKAGDLILAKPITFMNNSGLAVGELCRYFDIKPENVLILYDDIDIPLGSIRFKPNGGPGGHRGVESVIYHLRSENFKRLKLGIATNEQMRPAEKYVLKPFPEKYKNEIKILINHASDSLDYFLNHNIKETMNKFN